MVVTPLLVVLGSLMSLVVLLGVALTYMAYRAYRRTRQETMFRFAIGIGLLTMGAIAQGAAFNFLGWELAESQLLAAVTMVFAFGALLYSLYD